MFEIETSLIFWTVISFGILVFLLYKVVFPPLNKVLEQRRSAIEGRIEQAKKAADAAENLLKKYQNQLNEAERKTAAMFEDAERKSAVLHEEAVKSAQKEARQIIENTKADLEVFQRRALVSLKEEIANIVVEVNRKLIGKELNREDHLKLVEASIEELKKKNVKR